MIKTVTALTRNISAERLWTNAPTRFIVNNVTGVLRGKCDFTTLVEAWWPSASAIALKTETDAVLFSAVVDEVVFQTIDRPPSPPKGLVKTFSSYHLPPDVNAEEFWNYHANIHGPDVVNAAGSSLFDYSLNRRIETLNGQPIFFAMIEMWWSSDADRENYPQKCASYVTASGKSPLEDFTSRPIVSEYSVTVEEQSL